MIIFGTNSMLKVVIRYWLKSIPPIGSMFPPTQYVGSIFCLPAPQSGLDTDVCVVIIIGLVSP